MSLEHGKDIRSTGKMQGHWHLQWFHRRIPGGIIDGFIKGCHQGKEKYSTTGGSLVLSMASLIPVWHWCAHSRKLGAWYSLELLDLCIFCFGQFWVDLLNGSTSINVVIISQKQWNVWYFHANNLLKYIEKSIWSTKWLLQWLQYCSPLSTHCNAVFNIVIVIAGDLVLKWSPNHLNSLRGSNKIRFGCNCQILSITAQVEFQSRK